MTVEETAQYLKLTNRSVYNMIWDGRLPAARLGRNIIRLRRSDVDAALKPAR
jgi:excisionase family DNA binding protein